MIVDTLLKWTGFGWVWEKIDGAKTYIQAAAEMLTGAAAMLASAASELTNFTTNVHGIGDLWAFAQAMAKNPDPAALAFMTGWGVVLHGWGVMAAKHAADKRHAELLAVPVVVNVGSPEVPPSPASPVAAPLPLPPLASTDGSPRGAPRP